MIHYVTGDATAPIGDGPKIIAHIVNDAGGWGRGFVLAISKRWKKPELKYKLWYFATKSRIGETGFGLGATQAVDVEPGIMVANMIAQHGYISRNNPVPLQCDALALCLRKVRLAAVLSGASVHMPRIGCGLGGSTWDKIEPIVARELHGVDVFVYDLVAQ